MKKAITDIRKEFRRSSEARYIHRLHGVLLVFLGLSPSKAAELLGDPRRTIAHWVSEYKKHGASGLLDTGIHGRPHTLDTSQMNILINALKQSPQSLGLDGDKWTGALLSTYIQKQFGVQFAVRHCRRMLKELNNK